MDFVSAGFCRGNSVGSEQQRRAAMACEGCSVRFTVFKRRPYSVMYGSETWTLTKTKTDKRQINTWGREVLRRIFGPVNDIGEVERQCSICQRYYCSHCLPLGQNGGSNSGTSVLARFTDKKLKCSKCEVLTARPLIRSQLRQLRVKDLQLYLTSQQVSTRGCVEKDDLVNLLIRHAGNSSNNSQRSDFHSSRSGQYGMQGGDHSSAMQDQPPAYCFPSTSDTSHSTDFPNSRVSNERAAAAGSGAEDSATVPSSTPEHQETATTSSPASHDTTCHISTSSSSSSTPSNKEWFGEQSPTDVDIVELTDWAGDSSNSDSGPEPTITIAEDESPRRVVSEGTGVVVSEVPETTSAAQATTANNEAADVSVDDIESMEVDEVAEMVAENSEDDFEIIGAVPTETADEILDDGAIKEPIITTQACTGITLASIESVEDLEKLTVKQLKELLSLNRVDYRGCCEKPELIERVTRLWHDDAQTRKEDLPLAQNLQDNIVKLAYNFQGNVRNGLTNSGEQFSPHMSPDSASDPQMEEKECGGLEKEEVMCVYTGLDTMSMDELCKICMDAPVECVMLECGHMATCTACGKQLSECPICRQFVVRIVRTFRA
ncbi:hypothetical protein ANN_07585 [Periplaneta americana]|uniref:RING-type domain-containing protein n=1 Tax=Periplaneta americana TaxID=6978 RepID=A0ABQ8T090_PERAM|nr:hypothetical protein ANN_07585 [Periplaneta americana]